MKLGYVVTWTKRCLSWGRSVKRGGRRGWPTTRSSWPSRRPVHESKGMNRCVMSSWCRSGPLHRGTDVQCIDHFMISWVPIWHQFIMKWGWKYVIIITSYLLLSNSAWLALHRCTNHGGQGDTFPPWKWNVMGYGCAPPMQDCLLYYFSVMLL